LEKPKEERIMIMNTNGRNQESTQLPAEQICASTIPSPGVIKRLPMRHMLDAAKARTITRKLAEQLGYDLIDQLRLAAATFELAQLLMTWAGKGELLLLWYENSQSMGLKCYCCAEPPAIYRTGDKKRAKKPNLSRLKKIVDELEYLEDPHRGNGVEVTVWLKHNAQEEI
jgi:hypothetical protein